MPPTLLRRATPEDLQALGRIAYATGFFGAPAEVFFPDQTLFTDLWVRPYLYGAGCCNWVAEMDDRPIGYILGSCNFGQYQRWLLGYTPRLIWNALHGQYRKAWPSLPYLLRMARHPNPKAPLERYPAHLHLNLLPESRGLGLGQQLLQTHLDCLQTQGVSGVQLSTTRENQAAVGLYQKLGFEVYCAQQSPFWQPWLRRPVVHLVMTKTL